MSFLLWLGLGFVALFAPHAYAAVLEIPGEGANLSGIGVISGWKCEASGPITVEIDGGNPIPLVSPIVYRSERADTRSVCGDADNGFVAIWNWGIVGDGEHTAVAYDNGVEFARSTFRVTVKDFPSPGERTVFGWNEATQHLEMVLVEASQSKMYWVDAGTNTIHRANLDGSQVQDLLVTEGWDLHDLALDLDRGQMCWTDTGARVCIALAGVVCNPEPKIQRANLDGSQVQDLITTGLSQPGGLTLDLDGGQMYWTDADVGTKGTIRRANLDGSQVQDLVSRGLEGPWYLTLDLAGGQMYWTDALTGKIQRANLNGSQVQDLVSRGLDLPGGIALDLDEGKMYWTSNYPGKLQRANLDGSQVEDLVSTFHPRGLALALVE